MTSWPSFIRSAIRVNVTEITRSISTSSPILDGAAGEGRIGWHLIGHRSGPLDQMIQHRACRGTNMAVRQVSLECPPQLFQHAAHHSKRLHNRPPRR